MTSTYILVDTLLIGEPTVKPWLKKKRRPCWQIPIYERSAAEVSPVVIDIDAAQKAGCMDVVMEIVNSLRPQLGISFIETELTLRELADHLRQFIFILTEREIQLTLRFADCTVLSAIAKIVAPSKWAALTFPLISWKVHCSNTELVGLKLQNSVTPACTPLIFNDGEITALKEELGTYELLRNLRIMRPAQAIEFMSAQSYELAQQTRNMWRAAGHPASVDLTLFAGQVIDTNGRLLRVPGLVDILKGTDMLTIRDGIRRLASFQY